MKQTGQALGLMLGDLGRAWRMLLDQRLGPHGLSVAKWQTLRQLELNGDGISQKELAARVGIMGPTLVGLLDRLAAEGYIQRRESRQDRRCKTVHLTAKARRKLKEANAVAFRLRDELMDGIPVRELAACLGVLKRIKSKAGSLQ